MDDANFAAIRELLLERCRFDLRSYKDSCIRRRIARRARALGIERPAEYVSLLRRSEEEPDALVAALTIHVSQFFRNPSTFSTLEESVLPEIVRRAREGSRTVRIWSVGCSSGEEPYSLALLLEDLAPEATVSLLGTDVSEEILGRARAALYDPLRLTEVPTTLRHYFLSEGMNFRLQDAIRSRVRFERHDILSPPPYPEVDLILCRNVLIYFSRAKQEEILSRLAEALPEGGWLVLGKAEALLGAVRRLFTSEFPADRIYRRC